MKTHKSSKNTLSHRATRNENTQVFQEHPVTPGDADWKHKSSKNTLLHRATRNENTQVFQEHPVTPGDAEWTDSSLPRTPCYTGRRGMKRQKSSKNTLLHRATRNEKTAVFQEHPVTPGDAEWKDRSLPRAPCYTGRRGMRTHQCYKNTLLHWATRNENIHVFQGHLVPNNTLPSADDASATFLIKKGRSQKRLHHWHWSGAIGQLYFLWLVF